METTPSNTPKQKPKNTRTTATSKTPSQAKNKNLRQNRKSGKNEALPKVTKQLPLVIQPIAMVHKKHSLKEPSILFSVASKLLSTFSSVASLMIKPITVWVPSLFGFGSNVADEVTNRLDHNEKRSKIEKRIQQVNRLIALLPDYQKQQLKIPNEITDKKVIGANPASGKSTFTTTLSVLSGASIAGLSIAMENKEKNNWDDGASIAMGAVNIGLLLTHSALFYGEEHYKKEVLESHLNTLKIAKRGLVKQLSANGASTEKIRLALYPEDDNRSQNSPQNV